MLVLGSVTQQRRHVEKRKKITEIHQHFSDQSINTCPKEKHLWTFMIFCFTRIFSIQILLQSPKNYITTKSPP